MAHKAFAQIIAVYSNGQINAQYVVLNEDSTLISHPNLGYAYTQLEYADTAQSIHERIADAIRSQFMNADPVLDIVVVFPDAPGRF